MDRVKYAKRVQWPPSRIPQSAPRDVQEPGSSSDVKAMLRASWAALRNNEQNRGVRKKRTIFILSRSTEKKLTQDKKRHNWTPHAISTNIHIRLCRTSTIQRHTTGRYGSPLVGGSNDEAGQKRRQPN